jgi:GNAT superfamily N-acetyltransferase
MIREATVSDVYAMMSMGEEFVNQTQYRNVISFNEESAFDLALNMIKNPNALLLVSERDEVDGMIGMMIYDHPLSGQRMSMEAFWWMRPEARSGLAGVRLLRKAEEWVRSKGVKWMHMIAPDERVGKFYTRLGYEPVETHFYKRVAD